jgi:glutaminase
MSNLKLKKMEATKTTIALQVINSLSNALAKSPTGVSFVSIKGYTNSYGEVSNNLVNVGASLTSAKYSDIETLQSLDVTALNGDSILLEKARVELINSFIAPNENRSQGQIEAYTIVAKGIKVHNETGEIYVYGLRKSKTTLVEGVYPQVNSKPLTLAKNQLRKELKSSKFTQYKLSATSVIKTNGEEIIFE